VVTGHHGRQQPGGRVIERRPAENDRRGLNRRLNQATRSGSAPAGWRLADEHRVSSRSSTWKVAASGCRRGEPAAVAVHGGGGERGTEIDPRVYIVDSADLTVVENVTVDEPKLQSASD
jgi:hypothetical protein